MKKILLCLLLLLSLSACNKEKDKNGGTVVTPPKKNNGSDVVESVKGYVDYQKIYEDTVLKDMYNFMVNDGDEEEFQPLAWFYENYFNLDTGEEYYYPDIYSFAYAIVDLSGDEIPELVVEHLGHYDDGSVTEFPIFLYTIVDDKPKKVIVSYGTDYIDFLNDGTIYYTSRPATMLTQGLAKLSKDGTSLEWINFYYAEDSIDGPMDIRENKTGVVKDDDKVADISEEEFYNFYDEYVQGNEKSFIGQTRTFADYEVFMKPVYAYFADDELVNTMKDYTLYGNDNLTYKFVVVPNGKLRDVKLLSLNYTDGDFETEVIKEIELTDDKPLVIDAYLSEGAPNLGISFVGEDFLEYRYYFAISGYDGSAQLVAF